MTDALKPMSMIDLENQIDLALDEMKAGAFEGVVMFQPDAQRKVAKKLAAIIRQAVRVGVE